MESILSLFAEYGLLTIFVSVFAEQLGAPVPAMPFLLMAGAAAANDGVFAVKALMLATLAAMLADSLWFLAGRYFGRRTLALLCRISISPDSCVRQSELSFAKQGVATLVVAKFVPGLSTLAPPLAGALGMRSLSFVVFNLAGAALWAGSGIAGGLIFHTQIGQILKSLDNLGGIAMIAAIALLGLYIAWRVWRRWWQARTMASLPRVQPAELAEMIQQRSDLIIVDVRAASIQLPLKDRIPGARQIDLDSVESVSIDDWPAEAEIVTYCACPNDASAIKAAYLLNRLGLSVRVLSGGYDGWAASGHPLETI